MGLRPDDSATCSGQLLACKVDGWAFPKSTRMPCYPDGGFDDSGRSFRTGENKKERDDRHLGSLSLEATLALSTGGERGWDPEFVNCAAVFA